MQFEVGVVTAHPLVYIVKQTHTIIKTWIYCRKNGLGCNKWYGVFETDSENVIAQTGCLPGAEERAFRVFEALIENHNRENNQIRSETMEEQQIIWYRTNDPADVWREGVLVGCDPDIGITIVDKADPNIYVCCLIGPSAPVWRYIGGAEQDKMKLFTATYKLWVGMIANGFWNAQIDAIQTQCHKCPATEQSCPFGQ